MSKHTKGPWVVLEGGVFDKEIVITTENRASTPKVGICEMDVFFEGVIGEEQEANAHLIAAAPELLEALEAAMKFIDSHVADPDITQEMASAWYQLNGLNPHGAIAKAKGESQ